MTLWFSYNYWLSIVTLKSLMNFSSMIKYTDITSYIADLSEVPLLIGKFAREHAWTAPI